MFDRVSAELVIFSVYVPPFFFTVLIGFFFAFGSIKLLRGTGWIRYFWHPGLAFLSLWVLFTSLIGLTILPP